MSLVTAVVTTHRREPQMVERAIQSVLAQTHKALELIVVDDSPSDFALRDAVKDMTEKYSTVKYIQHKTCQGACAARNTGLEMAHGEFIGFLDDDDEWKPNKIERQLTGFVSESVALVYCESELVDSKTGEKRLRNPGNCQGKIFGELIKGNFVGSCSFPLIRTSALREIGGFDTQLLSSQDHDVWLRLAEKYDAAYIDEPLVTYYIHSGDQISKNYARIVNGLEGVDCKYKDYISNHREVFWIRKTRLAPAYAGNKQLGKALLLWCRCVLKCPRKVWGNLRCLYGIVRCALGLN